MNVAVLVEGGLVEVLQATPLLRSLEHAPGDLSVTLAATPAASELVGALPGVAELLPLAGLETAASLGHYASAWQRLRRRRFDAAILCGHSTRLRLLAHLAGFARRIGPGGGPGSLLLSDRLPVERGENNAAVWVRAAAVLGSRELCPELSIDPGESARRHAADVLAAAGFGSGRSVVAIAPGSAWLTAPRGVANQVQWPPQRFAHVANQLYQRHGLAAVLLGSPADGNLGEWIRSDLGLPHLDLCGRLSLREAAAVIERCDLFVGNDSPLLQIAAAMHVPALGVFGGSDAHVRGPYGAHQRAVQALHVTHERRHEHRAVIEDHRQPLISRVRVTDVVAWIEARDAA